VLYRRRDLEAVFERLTAAGHVVLHPTFFTGGHTYDMHVDTPPYVQDVHLKLLYQGFVTTSFGIAIRKGSPAA
ncbi:MAG TPA: hypothetical protein VGI86_04410, partial [Acidimicrobiia bacterium]